MKLPTYTIATVIAILTIGCNKQKAVIDENTEATKEAIDNRKSEVAAEAEYATEKTDANAKIDKATIEADEVSVQAQLDAAKKKAEADADAAKAKIDSEDR